LLSPFRSLVGMLTLLDLWREQQYRWRRSLYDKGLRRADAAHVDCFVCKSPALRMRVEVVPVHAKVEVEHVPANTLSRMCNNRRRVANERAAVEAVGGKVVAAAFDNTVLAGAIGGPRHLPTDTDGHVYRREKKVADRDVRATRAARLDGDRPAHRRSVDAAHVVVCRREGKSR